MEVQCKRTVGYGKRASLPSPSGGYLKHWLVEVEVEVEEGYKLSDETLHLAVSYTDRLFSLMSLMGGKL